MVVTKREDVTKQGFCKILKKTPSLGKSQISIYSFFLSGSGKGVGAYLSLSGSGRGVGVGAYLRLGAY